VTRMTEFTPQFVDFLPAALERGVLYVSMEYTTVAHLCACGCGNKIVTPLSPAQWRLMYDGTVSLRPSIGNWDLACQSHYWIAGNKVEWAPKWSGRRIQAARERDKSDLDDRFVQPASFNRIDGHAVRQTNVRGYPMGQFRSDEDREGEGKSL
jgi:Family of unknown function (DUF6527)